jgi:hypothetical protein
VEEGTSYGNLQRRLYCSNIINMLHSNPYLKYYRGQVGGSVDIPVFVGGQHGEGLGDFFRSVLRFIAPIALRGLSTFASSTQRAHAGGASLKDAARGAIGPSLGAMAGAVGESMRNQQAGTGMNAMFDGDEGVPYMNSATHVYKGVKEKKRHQTFQQSKSKRNKKHKQKAATKHGEYNF